MHESRLTLKFDITGAERLGAATFDVVTVYGGVRSLVTGGSAARAGGAVGEFRAVDHIGSSRGAGLSSINNTPRMDNCTACTTAKVLNGIQDLSDAEGWTATAVELKFGYTGRERNFSVAKSVNYIENATGMRAEVASFMDGTAEAGHYVLFPRVAGQPAQHVIYGQVLEGGARYLHDAQIGKTMSWEEMLKTYSGGAKAFVLKDPQ